jgi:hypothetical protein
MTVLLAAALMAGGAQANWNGRYPGGGGPGIYRGAPWGAHAPWHGYYRGWGPGIYWGGPVVVGLPWFPFGYYPSPPAVIQQTPVYVQPQQQEDAYYWYYCENPKGYYPYINNCPAGWMKVVPNANPQKTSPN